MYVGMYLLWSLKYKLLWMRKMLNNNNIVVSIEFSPLSPIDQ